MPDRSDPLRERAIAYVADWAAHHSGEPTGRITIPEMREFLHQHGFELTPPDDKTTFTATEYWHAVLKVATDRVAPPDRVLSITRKA